MRQAHDFFRKTSRDSRFSSSHQQKPLPCYKHLLPVRIYIFQILQQLLTFHSNLRYLNTMSYAAAASKGPSQTAEEVCRVHPIVFRCAAHFLVMEHPLSVQLDGDSATSVVQEASVLLIPKWRNQRMLVDSFESISIYHEEVNYQRQMLTALNRSVPLPSPSSNTPIPPPPAP